MDNKIKKLTGNYLRLATWFALHEGDQSVSVEQFETVLNEIGNIEDELVKNSVSSDSIEKLSKFITHQNLLTTPLEKCSTEQQLMILKCIFGGGVEWSA